MTNFPKSLLPIPVLIASLLPLSAAAALSGNAIPSVAASDPAFTFEGRFDREHPDAIGVVWQGSRIAVDFEGDPVALQFSQIKGQNYFDAELDGQRTLVELCEGAAPRGLELKPTGGGRHHLVLFKRSEAAAGTARFLGLTLGAEGRVIAPKRSEYKTAFQFFGDSITAGACNEDGAADQWEDRSTHNNARSYGAFTASAFSADYRNIAVSGMGISIGWVPMKAGEIWDRIYPTADSVKADLTTWTPDVVFVNLGENDDSYTKANNLPFPANFSQSYVSLVRAFRAAYPKAQIVVLRGGMFGGAQSERLRGPWEAAVEELERTDRHLTHFVFKHWSSTHPRVSDHRAMADELIAWLKTQPFMAAAQ